MRQNHAEFANFLCHFGEDKVLLDYLEDIIIPAFMDDTLTRSIGKENKKIYHFYSVNIDMIDASKPEPIIAISGYFIKDINLVRTHTFDKKQGLIENPQIMESSPSSFFLLILNNHQLVFCPRTPHAPSISEFQSTTKQFISTKYNEFIDETYEKIKEENKKKGGNKKEDRPSRVTKKNLREKHPAPNIEIVSLTNSQGIKDFVLRFDKLNSVDFRLLKPNPTFVAGEAFSQVREILHDIGANNGRIHASNAAEGLDKEKSIKVIDEATSGGNQQVSLRGVTSDGTILSGNNNDFKATTPISNPTGSRKNLVNSLYASFLSVFSTASITDQHSQHQGLALRKLTDDILNR